MRYSFAPIDAHRGDTELRVIAEKIDRATATVEGWRRTGMSEENADLVATALGLHPWQLWPEMLVRATAPVMRECEVPGCYEEFLLTRSDKRFCSDRCREKARATRKAEAMKAKYHADAEYRARKLQRRRAYYETTSRRAELAKQRVRDRENAEVLNERRRERRQAKREAA